MVDTLIQTLDGELTLEELARFKKWLRVRNHAMLERRTLMQVLRYIAGRGTIGIVYTDGLRLVPNVPAFVHLRCFRAGKSIETPGALRERRIRYLRKRDGDDCCLCSLPMTTGEMSIEHWVPVSRDGTEDYANLGLAHRWCNEVVADLCVSEKLIVRDVLADYVTRNFPTSKFQLELMPSQHTIRAWAKVPRIIEREPA